MEIFNIFTVILITILYCISFAYNKKFFKIHLENNHVKMADGLLFLGITIFPGINMIFSILLSRLNPITGEINPFKIRFRMEDIYKKFFKVN